MSFLIPCPQCGDRSAYEFRFGGEVRKRPTPQAPEPEWIQYVHHRNNTAGVHTEWWFHRSGCRQWIQAERNTVTNRVLRAFLPEENA